MKIIFETSRYLVTAGGDPALQPVVTFHPRRDKPGIERHRDKPWMRKPIEQAGYHWIAVTTEHNDWYQHSDMDEAVQAINRYLGGVRPLTFGFSMGGLAAWQYADALNALGWVGVSPNFEGDFADEFDPRARDERQILKLDCGYRTGIPVPPNGHAIFDPKCKMDRLHLEAIQERQAVTVHPYVNAGHSCLVAFAKEGKLAERLGYHFNLANLKHANSL